MKRRILPLLLGSALSVSACAEEAADADMEKGAMAADPPEEPMAAQAGDIVAVAQGNPDFSRLVIAITAAGLGETLGTGGPFTVFAPTNAAFDALPDGTLAELTMPENRERLAGLLTYHLVEGETTAAALASAIGSSGGSADLATVNGATLAASIDDAGNVVLTDAAGNTATVTQADMDASNGVIHEIDAVLMPS